MQVFLLNNSGTIGTMIRFNLQGSTRITPQADDVGGTGIPTIGVTLAAQIFVERNVRVRKSRIIGMHQLLQFGIYMWILCGPPRHGGRGIFHIASKDEGVAVGLGFAPMPLDARSGRILGSNDIFARRIFRFLPFDGLEQGEDAIVIGRANADAAGMRLIRWGTALLFMRISFQIWWDFFSGAAFIVGLMLWSLSFLHFTMFILQVREFFGAAFDNNI